MRVAPDPPRLRVALSEILSPFRLLPATLYGQGGIAGGELGIGFAVRPRLGAFLHQPFSGVGHAPAPGNRGHAEHEIGAAHIGASAFAVERRAVHAARIARPAPIAAG